MYPTLPNPRANIERQWKIDTYNSEIYKVNQLYPCKICATVKYRITECGVQKACEQECEHLKQFNLVVDEYNKMLVGVLRLKPDKADKTMR